MGVFNALRISCDACKTSYAVEFQSKKLTSDGDDCSTFCSFDDLVDEPDIVRDMNGQRARCQECGVEFVFSGQVVCVCHAERTGE